MTIISCKKTKANIGCPLITDVIQVIIKQPATINISDDKVYIVPKGSIDTRLIPCNLADEFRVDKLEVIVSGEVLLTSRVAGEPCCEPAFGITEISK